MNADGEIYFSSFLAGALLTHGKISNIDLVNYMSSFENEYNIEILDDGILELFDIITFDNFGFKLSKQYDEHYSDQYTVKEYLCSMTSDKIRTFFGYNEQLSGILCNNRNNTKNNNILKKIRTRIFH